MSLPKPDLHIRIHPLAKARLSMIAESQRRTEISVAQETLEAALLGAGHTLILAVEQYTRAGSAGNRRD